MDPDLSDPRGNVRTRAENRAQHADLKPLDENVHFQEAVFPALLKPSGIKFNNHGDLEVTMVIPVRYADKLDTMRLAMRTPLLVHIERWRNLDLERDDG